MRAIQHQDFKKHTKATIFSMPMNPKNITKSNVAAENKKTPNFQDIVTKNWQSITIHIWMIPNFESWHQTQTVNHLKLCMKSLRNKDKSTR